MENYRWPGNNTTVFVYHHLANFGEVPPTQLFMCMCVTSVWEVGGGIHFTHCAAMYMNLNDVAQLVRIT